ncbi:hypothetical protein GCM10009720_26640 [Yaniella flava]|uniref:Lipoprotein n=1 Tax=Yaniella flava TaxID=287930 RepID=A0ABN2UV45_9MICC
MKKRSGLLIGATIGLFVLAGCAGGGLNDPDIDPNFESLEGSYDSTTGDSTPQHPNGAESSDASASLEQSCTDYLEFDQASSDAMDAAIGDVSEIPSADEISAAREVFVEAQAEMEAIVEAADDAAFLAEAEQLLSMFDAMMTVTDPDASATDVMGVAQSIDVEGTIAAEERLLSMCQAEVD